MFSYVKVMPFYFSLRLGNSTRYDRMLNWCVFRHIKSCHKRGNCISSKNSHYVVVECYKKQRFSGISLSSTPSAQLVVNSSRLMPFCPNNIQPSKTYDFVVFFLPIFPLRSFPAFLTVFGFWSISAENNVYTAAGNICCNSNCSFFSRLCDSLSFFFVILTI